MNRISLAALLLLVSYVAKADDLMWFDREIADVSAPTWKDRSPKKDYDWENNSVPLGNGSIGASVMSSVANERVIFNEKTLWLGGPNTEKGAAYYWNANKDAYKFLPEIRKAFLDGDLEKANKLTTSNFGGTAPYGPWSEKPFRFGNYTVAGEFWIRTGMDGAEAEDFKRGLSLDSAYAFTAFNYKGHRYARKSFISYPRNAMVMEFSTDHPEGQHLHLGYIPNPMLSGQFIAVDGDELLYNARLGNNGMNFVLRVKALVDKGSVVIDDKGEMIVEGASKVMIVAVSDTDYKINFDPDFNDDEAYVGVDPVKTTQKWLKKAASRSFKDLFEEHYKDYASLYTRVALELNPDDRSAAVGKTLPMHERMDAYERGAKDYALEAMFFKFGRYLLISSSRPGNLPANLQGIWQNDTDGPWRSDYHNNINIQMNYWPACPTALSECEIPYIDYIRSLVEPGKRTAKAYYNADGWTASISGNIFGFTSPLANSRMTWNMIPAAGPWLAIDIWNYYDYTRNMKFLKDTGYNVIRESARFAADYMWKRPDGYYVAAPATSPEHGPVEMGVTFVNAVVKELLADAIKASELLGKDEEEREEWREVMEHIEPYKIGRYGQLMEWSRDIDDPEDTHRHMNHLFGLHPGNTISPVTTPELAEAAKVVLNHRGDVADGWGWSMGWKINQWARLYDAERAYVLYVDLLKNGASYNLWNTHPPFQIDGNFGGTAGIVEMFLQSHMGFIHLLPALPEVWKEGRFTGIKTRGNFTVDIFWKGGRLDKAVVRSCSGGMCRMKYDGMDIEFDTRQGGEYVLKVENGKIRVI